ncbi:hypothetical protein D5b_00391 [Faustovirus]|nr:hypothetical protein D5b_00391 [Faustovirus]AMN84524.1 hypothetical protein D6_00115 [Faustovirus]AMP44334.1 hypothetical protein PRJ_Dakar_00382 [Faustovirus]
MQTEIDDIVNYYSPYYDSDELTNDSILDISVDDALDIDDLDSDMEWDEPDAITEYLNDVAPYSIRDDAKYVGWNAGKLGRYTLHVELGHKGEFWRQNTIIYMRTRNGAYTSVVNDIDDLDKILKEAPLSHYDSTQKSHSACHDANNVYNRVLDIINQGA